MVEEGLEALSRFEPMFQRFGGVGGFGRGGFGGGGQQKRQQEKKQPDPPEFHKDDPLGVVPLGKAQISKHALQVYMVAIVLRQ